MRSAASRSEPLDLKEAAEYLLEECRMVLPGIQALFGFQLVAVFSPGFQADLTVPLQKMHLLAIALIACAVAMIMTPAAFHRQSGIRRVTDRFIRISTRLLICSMVPLALGICIDFYLIAGIVLDHGLALLSSLCLLGLFIGLWFVLPRASRAQGDKAG